MNKQRRKDIQAIVEKLEALQTLKDELMSDIEAVRDEEQEYYDNMPDAFHDGDKGYAAEAAVGNLEEASSMLNDLDIDTLRGNLETAAE